MEPSMPPQQQSTCGEFSELAEQARRRAEIARYVSSIILTYISYKHHAFLVSFSYDDLNKSKCMNCRLRELTTYKGQVEAAVRRKGLDFNNIPQNYTV
jgi:hypothetical protein